MSVAQMILNVPLGNRVQGQLSTGSRAEFLRDPLTWELFVGVQFFNRDLGLVTEFAHGLKPILAVSRFPPAVMPWSRIAPRARCAGSRFPARHRSRSARPAPCDSLPRPPARDKAPRISPA